MDSPLLGTSPAGSSLSGPFSITRGPWASEYTSVTSPGPCPMCRLFRAGHAVVHAELGSVALQIFTSQWMKTNGCSAINSNASRLKRCSWSDGGEWNWTVASLGQLIQHKKKQRQHRVFSFRLAALGPWSNISKMATQRLNQFWSAQRLEKHLSRLESIELSVLSVPLELDPWVCSLAGSSEGSDWADLVNVTSISRRDASPSGLVTISGQSNLRWCLAFTSPKMRFWRRKGNAFRL